MVMIVIGLDVHKHSVTAVAVDEAGRPLDERLIPAGSDELLAWASELDPQRLWAVEDCRQLTRWLERQLLGVGEERGAVCRSGGSWRAGLSASTAAASCGRSCL
jgi:hypothetical protein